MKNPLKSHSRMPIPVRAGLVLFFSAAALDLFYHTLEALALHDAVARLETVVGADAYPVHVLLFIGMVVIVLGILTIRGSDDHSEVRPHQPESRSAV